MHGPAQAEVQRTACGNQCSSTTRECGSGSGLAASVDSLNHLASLTSNFPGLGLQAWAIHQLYVVPEIEPGSSHTPGKQSVESQPLSNHIAVHARAAMGTSARNYLNCGTPGHLQEAWFGSFVCRHR